MIRNSSWFSTNSIRIFYETPSYEIDSLFSITNLRNSFFFSFQIKLAFQQTKKRQINLGMNGINLFYRLTSSQTKLTHAPY